MGLLKFFAISVVAVAIVIGYTIYSVPVPDDMTDKYVGQVFTGLGKVSDFLCKIGQKLNVDKFKCQRWVMDTNARVQNVYNSNVKMEITEFGGVTVRIYDPVGRKEGGPAVMYFHGGGWVYGSTEFYHSTVQNIADLTKFLVVSVEYRLAPEHKYPAALDDCVTATEYLMANAGRYKIDPSRIAVMGDSAGGNLAATVSLKMRDAKRGSPKIQLPIYPMGVLKFLAFSAAAVAIVIGYTIYSVPVPDDMTDKLVGQKFTGLMKVSDFLCQIGQKLNVDKFNCERWFFEMTARVQNEYNNAVKMEITEFDGVTVRIYDPVSRKEGGPAVMFFHGGGWVLGSTAFYHNTVQRIADLTKFLIVSVEYRRAPEHKYPAAVDDCVTATEYLMANAARYKIDPSRIAVMGDSAGGNLAAAVSLKMRDSKRGSLKIQLPIYPVVQALDFNLPSYQNDTKVVLKSDDGPYFTLAYILGTKWKQVNQKMIKLWRSNRLYSTSVWEKHGHKVSHENLPKHHFHHGYKFTPVPKDNVGFSQELDRLIVDPYFSPLMADNLSGMPEAFVITCQYDMLRDDGFLYVKRLQEAGVKVKHRHHMTCFHGVVTLVKDHELLIEATKFLAENL